MKLLFDFFPILLFFVAFKLYDIFTATAVAIAATIVQVAVSWLRERRVEKMHLLTLGLIVVLGGATLIFHNELFIKWKPTAVNWAFALAFLGSHFVGGQPLVKRLMSSSISLPDSVWRRLNLSWVTFFAVLGAVNIVVAYGFDTDTWVNFKLFGMMGLTLAFIIGQALVLSRFLEEKQQETD